jgi:hypothetical protein
MLSVGANMVSAEKAPAPVLSTPEQDQFFNAISSHCGAAYSGVITSTDAADADFAGESLVMHVMSCSDEELRVPFFVGDDRSRTWVITKTGSGLQLKHDHRHEDGTSDDLTMYGGMTNDLGSSEVQYFPADAPTKALFDRENIPQSKPNVWTITVTDEYFRYELTRPGRHFAVEFDLSNPIATPEAPW